MKRCARCIFPETIPDVTFDNQGVCSYCQNYQPIVLKSEDKLLKLIETAKAANQKYDCIVPLSGGRDSTFVLYLSKKKFDLNPLAVNFNNEFRNEQALKNMVNACRILDVDLVSFKSKRNLAHRIIPHSIKHTLRFGIELLTRNICLACVYGYHAVVYREAEKYSAPLILWGFSQVEQTTHMTSKHLRTALEKNFVKKINIHHFRSKYYQWLLRMEFPVPGNFSRNIRLRNVVLKNKNIKEIWLYNYIPWDRKKAKEIIMSELRWKKPDDAISTWRTDCYLEPLLNYCFMNIFGCSKHCFGYHNMINENQMSREEALEQESKQSHEFTPKLEVLLRDRIGLSEKEIEVIKSFQNNL